MKRGITIIATIAVLATAGLFVGNHVAISHPVAEALANDHRNTVLNLSARFNNYVDFNTLELSIEDSGDAAAADTWRALFMIAEAMMESGRTFDRVVLSHRGTPVFVLSGEDFQSIGRDRAIGQNPVYMVRTLPEKLLTPDGAPAYDRISGGLLAVTARQMEYVNEAATRWVLGRSD